MAVRRGHDDEVVLARRREQLIRRGDDRGIRVRGPRLGDPLGVRVTIDVSASPGTASTSGAWNADPARP